MDKNIIGLSIILPIYNDAAALSRFLPELFTFTNQQDKSCEIILIDDGSTDHLTATYEQLRQQLPSNTALRLVQFSRNFGKEAFRRRRQPQRPFGCFGLSGNTDNQSSASYTDSAYYPYTPEIAHTQPDIASV